MTLRSKKAIRRLGDRLRSVAPTKTDLRELDEFRDQYLGVLARMLTYLVDIPNTVALSARQKNANTIIEKLGLFPDMSLPTMADVAGARLIVKGGRRAQDQVLNEIHERLQVKKTKDRRHVPMCGYRALHAIVDVDSYPAEIQIRTVYQDRWAQVFERLGDYWGRQIRRGGKPEEPDRPVGIEGVPVSRIEIVNEMMDIAERISMAENIESNSRDGGKARKVFSEVDSLLEALSQVVPSNELPDVHICQSATLPVSHATRFIVVYERRSGSLLEVFPIVDMPVAIEQRTAFQEKYPDAEIVLLESKSAQDLKRTHARYFERTTDLLNPPKR